MYRRYHDYGLVKQTLLFKATYRKRQICTCKYHKLNMQLQLNALTIELYP